MADRKLSPRTITLISVAVLAVLIVVIWPLSMLGKGGAPAENSDDVEQRIAPVARVEVQNQQVAVKSDGKPRDGLAVYNLACTVCHAGGVAGAPKTGDKAAWAPRIAQGAATLLKNAINGKGAMPPRGGVADLSDAEVKAAVDYLVAQAK